jgi:rhamnose utilization protein RhaD (predicted bifunctional aldolase and dehydrogenase)/NAD(P)-dependent dehydrogenase (short-subunit alcohol dehydrogenase family)
MKSRWSDADFKSVVDGYTARGINRDLAIRTYTTRLLGADPELVLHGGGNTSVKTVYTDLDGSEVNVLCVKGSGWDMGTIEPQGLPAVRLEPLQALTRFDTLSDDNMVMLQRRLLMNPSAPNPSVEAVLHAVMPFRHVDHTHANAIVSLTNQPQGAALIRDLYPDSIIVPYVMPGFDLAKVCDAAMKAEPEARGMILLKHGIFTWSDDPREAYEAMIAMIAAAEARLARGRALPFSGVTLPTAVLPAATVAPILRGAISIDTGVEGRPKRFVLEHRASAQVMDFCNAVNASALASRGNATPEHVLRIKRTGIALAAPSDAVDFAATVRDAVQAYVTDYTSYFTRNNARFGGTKIMLDPMPRVFYVAGVGLFAAAASAKEARAAADVAEATVEVITKAEGIDAFEALPEADLFDIEYWSLEQAKLAGHIEKPLSRQVAVVTGAASGLGLAVAEALRADGAEVALLDITEDALLREAKRLGGIGIVCDVTDPAAVDAAISEVAARLGGVDILISNAGAAFQGALTDVADAVFHKAFDLNFWGHHNTARAVVRVMKLQGTGGAIVFNVSKQAVNPGPDFGPYGTSKAALMALMRQYAVEHGGDGITSNAVNADRIRTGLMTDQMVAERSKARGLTPEAYMRGNLVRREVTAADVAAAFLHLAKVRTSTGAVLTVDGGNVAAMMR